MGLGAYGPALAWLLPRLLSRPHLRFVWVMALLLAAVIVAEVLYLTTRDRSAERSVFDVNYVQVMECLGERWDPFDPNRTLDAEVSMLKFCVTIYPHSQP